MHYWWVFVCSPGFGGLAALAAALIAFWAATSSATKSAKTATANARTDQWWVRARWALDLLRSESARDREIGLECLIALRDSESWANEYEEIVEAALEISLYDDSPEDEVQEIYTDYDANGEDPNAHS